MVIDELPADDDWLTIIIAVNWSFINSGKSEIALHAEGE